VGPRAVLDAVVKRELPSLRRESNPRTPIVQPVAQHYTTELGMPKLRTRKTGFHGSERVALLVFY
jgi:hypothetical protein